jgi:AcrR family transcriptional regulator
MDASVGHPDEIADRPLSLLGLLGEDRERAKRSTTRDAQRLRILAAMVQTTAEKGFINVTVGDVVAGAGVSRTTFYELFDGKLSCYLAAFDTVSSEMTAEIKDAFATARGHPIDTVFGSFFSTLETFPAAAKFCLVEVYAAGPEAVRRRVEGHRVFVEGLEGIHRALTDAGAPVRPLSSFDFRVMIAGASALVTNHVAIHGAEGLAELAEPVIRHVRRAFKLDPVDVTDHDRARHS